MSTIFKDLLIKERKELLKMLKEVKDKYNNVLKQLILNKKDNKIMKVVTEKRDLRKDVAKIKHALSLKKVDKAIAK